MGSLKCGENQVALPGGGQIPLGHKGCSGDGHRGCKGQKGIDVFRFTGGSRNLRPAIVLPWLQQVYLVITAGSVFGNEQVAGLGMPVQPLGIAMAVGIDVGVGEGIVGRDGTVGGQPQHFAGQGTQVLRQVRVCGVAGGGVQVTIGAEPDAAPVMARRPGDAVKNWRVVGSLSLAVGEAGRSG